jgi:hypothetical protein
MMMILTEKQVSASHFETMQSKKTGKPDGAAERFSLRI